jgi:hypothetical protein
MNGIKWVRRKSSMYNSSVTLRNDYGEKIKCSGIEGVTGRQMYHFTVANVSHDIVAVL